MSEPKTAEQFNRNLTGSVTMRPISPHAPRGSYWRTDVTILASDPVSKLIEYLEGGAVLTLTTSAGKKVKIILQDVKEKQ